MGSPAVKLHKRASKSSSSASEKSRVSVCMTTSTVSESFVESKLFGWLRVFRFANLLTRQE